MNSMGWRTRPRSTQFVTIPLNLLAVRQHLQAVKAFGRAHFLGPFVPASSHDKIGGDAEDAAVGENDGIIGCTHGNCRSGVAGIGGTKEQDPRAPKRKRHRRREQSNRAEVVRGVAEVTIGEEVRLHHENESAYVPIGAVHRLANPGEIPLELIEVKVRTLAGPDAQHCRSGDGQGSLTISHLSLGLLETHHGRDMAEPGRVGAFGKRLPDSG
jgi:Mannose-6-phosphate isomerase